MRLFDEMVSMSNRRQGNPSWPKQDIESIDRLADEQIDAGNRRAEYRR